MKANYYNLLDLPFDASPEEIREVYYAKMKLFHPDADDSSEAKQMFFLIQEAYNVLKDEKLRSAYDASINHTDATELHLKEIVSSPAVQLIDEEQLFYYMIEVTQNKSAKGRRENPICLVLVVDRSTSMSGERLVLVKNGIIRLLKQLKDDDMIGVIAFSDKAEVIIPMMSVEKAKFQEQRILTIQAFGATEMLRGLQSAASLINNRDMKQFSKKIILLTDGHTYGDEEECESLAEDLGQKSVELYAVGFGNEWNDAFLDKVTELSGGIAEFAETSEQLSIFFQDKILKNTNIFADVVQLECKASEQSRINYCFRISPDAAPILANGPSRLGSLYENQRLILLFEMIISPLDSNIKKCSLITGKLFFNAPNQVVAKRRIAFAVEIPVTVKLDKTPPSPLMLNAISKLTLYRMQEKARQEVRANLPKKASQRLNQLASQLLDQGEKELAINVIQESQNILKSGYFTKDGEKRIKYGTRKLLLNSGIEQK